MNMIVCKLFLSLFMFFFNNFNCQKQSYSGWNLLYLFKKRPGPNLQDFQYQIWTSVKRLGKQFCNLYALTLG